jgi:hypothetical protein
MKFTKVFRGVPDGGIYPVEYQPGDACPPELVHAAMEVDGVEAVEAEKTIEPPAILAPEAAPVADTAPAPQPEPVVAPPVAKSTRKASNQGRPR